MLSARALAWLDELAVAQRRARLGDEAMRNWLAMHSLPAWPALLAVEARYGGLANTTDSPRHFSIGVGDGFGSERMIDGRRHLLVARYSPIEWYMDEAGRIAEVDDLGETFYVSDSIEHRIEQVAVCDHFAVHTADLDGFHGSTIAAALRLTRVEEACDSRQRVWMSDDVLVRDSLEPCEYGARDLVEKTWVSANSQQLLNYALAAKE